MNLIINKIRNQLVYKVIIIGAKGVGKSQFCNFIRRDKSNSINKASNCSNLCTIDPFSNFFQRNGINYKFIDTAVN